MSSEGESLTTFGVAGTVLYHFNPDASRSRFYVGGGFTWSLIDISGVGDGNQFGLAAGGGLKLPIVPRLGARLEASFTRLFESDDFVGANVISFSPGLSFFTR